MENSKDSKARAASPEDESANVYPAQEKLLKGHFEKVREQAKKEWLERNLYCEFDKSYICPLKRVQTYDLHLMVRPEYLACQFCTHLHELGVKHKEANGNHQFGSVQQEILDELQMCASLSEEIKIADPNFSKKTNHIRRQAIKELQKHYLVVARKRPEPNPTHPNQWEETTRATLTVLGAIVTNKVSKEVQGDPKLLLKEPEETSGWYLKFLMEGKKLLYTAIPAVQQRRTKKPKPRKEEGLRRNKNVLDEVPQTLMQMVIEIGTIEDYAEGKPIPEDPYQLADQIQDAIPEETR